MDCSRGSDSLLVICSRSFFCSLSVVGFTNISSELEPRKVADMLDRLYTRFDALSNEYDIFKVEVSIDQQSYPHQSPHHHLMLQVFMYKTTTTTDHWRR